MHLIQEPIPCPWMVPFRSCRSEPKIWEGHISQKLQAGLTNQVHLHARVRGARESYLWRKWGRQPWRWHTQFEETYRWIPIPGSSCGCRTSWGPQSAWLWSLPCHLLESRRYLERRTGVSSRLISTQGHTSLGQNGNGGRGVWLHNTDRSGGDEEAGNPKPNGRENPKKPFLSWYLCKLLFSSFPFSERIS